ncbi:MAG: hypothetical protein K0R00_2036 [Herbinix sp.]|jgi:hypothetical protein|nr:hypothetical protein [Herbinix sp.]
MQVQKVVILENGIHTHYYRIGKVVTISNLVTSIGPFVFDSDSTITRVIIPDSVISIGTQAFLEL